MTRGTWRSCAVLLVVAAAIAAVAPPARAHDEDPGARQQQIADELDRLRSRYDEADAEEAHLLAAYDASHARTHALEERIRALDAELATTRIALRHARSRLADVEERRRGVQARIDRVETRRDEAQQTLQDQAVAAYMGTSDGSRFASLLLRAKDARQVLLTTGYAEVVAQRQKDLIDELDELGADLERLGARLATARRIARDARDDIGRRVAGLEAARNAQARARAAVVAEASHQEELLDRVRSRKQDYEDRIAELREESDAIAALLRARQASQGITPSGHGVLSVPIPGAQITSGFGPRVHPIFHSTRVHTGVDFAAASGTPIHAAAAGEVVWAGWRGGYGLATIIDHGGSLATLYAHQSSVAVSVGSVVTRGQVIGAVGSTGFSTGPHLHFEVRVNGIPVDPMNYL